VFVSQWDFTAYKNKRKLSENFDWKCAVGVSYSLVRKHTEQRIGEIRQNLVSGRPVVEEQPHHNSYGEFIESTKALVKDLESENEQFIIEIDGEIETTEYMRNVFQRWFDIGDEIKDYDSRVDDVYKESNKTANKIE